MTQRAGRRALYLGFAALCGVGGAAFPAAAQSYLADNGSSVTVDYSVLGQGAGPGPVTRAPLPGSAAMPSGTCSCADAPLGVIAAAPRPTFTNPFGPKVTQAPAVPPGFIAYSQIAGSQSSGSAVVLRQPGTATQQMATAEPMPEPAMEPMSEPDMTPPPSMEESSGTEEALPATTPTQNAPAAGTGSSMAATGNETPPEAPETMPTDVPSPVEQPAESAPAPDTTQMAETTPEPPAAETPPETPPASSAATSTAEAPQTEQQAALTPEAPAEAATPPAGGGSALPEGAYRILYTGESDDVPASATTELDKIAQDMLVNQDKRVQVMAYAAGTEDTESKARRKSLARGLAVRSYLIKAGVPSTRIDVRALGNKVEGGPADRVDIVPAS